MNRNQLVYVCGVSAISRQHLWELCHQTPQLLLLRKLQASFTHFTSVCNVSHSSSCFVQGHGDCRQSINMLLTSITRVTYYHSAPVSLPRKYLHCMKIKEGDPTLLEHLKPFKNSRFHHSQNQSDKDMG